jgi:ABC-type glycerol-3-phosphate transport system substrate-binding protein
MDTSNGNGRIRATTRQTRRGAVALAAGGAAGLLAAACTQQATPAPAQSAKPATVRYLHFDTGQQVWQENWGKIFSTFADKYPGKTVQTDLVTQALTNISQKAIATAAGGDYYDTVYGHFTILSTFLESNLIQPLDTFLSKDKDVRADDFFAAAQEKMQGKLYGIAWFTQGKELFYNANLLQESGAPNPRQMEKEGKWTWDALLDVARQVTKAQGDQISVYGYNAGFTDPGTIINHHFAWGADWYDRNMTRPTLDSPQFLTATQFAVDLVAKHKVSGGGNFQQRTLGMLLGSGSSTRGWDEQIMRQNLFQIEHTMLPKGPAGRATAMANNCNYICRQSKEPDATWLFYKHLIGQDVQPQIAGLGGGRYTANKKLKPTTLFPFEDKAVYEASAAISRPTPLIVKQADLQKEWADRWKDMVEGKLGVKDALTQLQEKATLWLKDGGCIC